MATSHTWPSPSWTAIHHLPAEPEAGLPELVSLARTEFYEVIPGQPVTLEILAAEGQSCRTCLLLNGHPLPVVDGSGSQPIGTSLGGSLLHVRTVVSNPSPERSGTRVVYVLNGGLQTRRFVCSTEAGDARGPAQFILAVVFRIA